VVEELGLFCSPDDKVAADILMVDDRASNLARLRAMLELPGYRFTVAKSGKSALQALERTNEFAVILMDSAMPGLDGFETVRLIRQQELLRRIPVVMLTANGRRERLDAAHGGGGHAGAIDYVARPVDPVVLRAKVAVFVDLYHKSRELERWGVKLDQWIQERAALIDSVQANYRLIAENAGDLIAMLDRDGRRIYASPSFLRYFGADEVAPGSDSFALVHPDDREHIAEIFRHTLATGEGRRAEYRLVTRSGEVRYFESDGNPVFDRSRQVTHVVVVSRDITERHQIEERMRHLANHDVLTALPNRNMFIDYLGQALAIARRYCTRVAVMFVDLDYFKAINDSLGHDAGDHVLKWAAERIRGCLREEDLVARQGGDEFCVMVTTRNGGASVRLVAEKILETLAEPLSVGGQTLRMSASIGISLFPDDGAEPENLIRRADLAMYEVKKGGRRHIRFFSPEMERADTRTADED
jgi:diguanylate cyclase (GGDEF)-like protein/PAS domain S-box-containing protein